MARNYELERQGQIDFFQNYGIPYEEDNSILVDNTDGVYNGNILEFKLSINNLNKVLFQAIKYLSRMRIKGESIPANILLITMKALDIVDNEVIEVADVTVKKAYKTASKLYPKVSFEDEDLFNVHCGKDGYISQGVKVRVKSYYNENMIGYLEADSFQIDANVRNITRFALYNGNGCYLTKENYLTTIPLWAAKFLPQDKWYYKDIHATTSDGGTKYTKDEDFLKSCLIYACLSNQNKCLSMKIDGKVYKNELCFDNGSLLSKEIKKYTLNDFDKKLIEQWNEVLAWAKKADNYNPEYSYGIYQIEKELDTYTETEKVNKKQKEYDYPELHGNLETLRNLLKEYYYVHIMKKMFDYELIK